MGLDLGPTLDTIIRMGWGPFANANGTNTRAGKLGWYTEWKGVM